jgi:methyltransferase
MSFALLAYVIAERLLELVVARRNTARLMARGAVEVGAGHYPVMIALHVSWLVAIVAWVAMTHAAVSVPLLILYVALQGLRFWVMGTLGPYWTTRIITVPDAPLIKSGPYRFLRHPNYVVVTLEIALLPLVFGAWQIALVYTVLNALMLRTRIAAENGALSARGASSAG